MAGPSTAGSQTRPARAPAVPSRGRVAATAMWSARLGIAVSGHGFGNEKVNTRVLERPRRRPAAPEQAVGSSCGHTSGLARKVPGELRRVAARAARKSLRGATVPAQRAPNLARAPNPAPGLDLTP